MKDIVRLYFSFWKSIVVVSIIGSLIVPLIFDLISMGKMTALMVIVMGVFIFTKAIWPAAIIVLPVLTIILHRKGKLDLPSYWSWGALTAIGYIVVWDVMNQLPWTLFGIVMAPLMGLFWWIFLPRHIKILPANWTS